MLRSYLKVALRNLRKQKYYALINVFGLAIGIACCVLIMLFARHELSFDRFHEKTDRIYRAWGREDWGEGRAFFYTETQYILASTLESNLPDVEKTTRVMRFQNLVGPDEARFTERIHLVDSDFFDVFSFRLRRGDRGSVLKELSSVVLTPEVARKYFGDADPLGKTLPIQLVDTPQLFTVTGIAEPPPAASSIQFDILIPFENVRSQESERALQSWTIIGPETYVLLRDGAQLEAVNRTLPDMITQVLGERAAEIGLSVGLQPITDIHLNQEYPVGIEPTSDPAYAYLLSAIAVLVLLIASINFVTLSIGQSTRRSLEVGIRKAMGAARSQLMRQFWGEALLLVTLSVLVGVILAFVLLPVFNTLSGRELVLTADAWNIGFLLILVVAITAGAGSYPALVLSGFRPIEVLKDRLQFTGDKSLLRRGLVVVQFALAILMIASAFVVGKQIRYLQTKNLGFDKEQVVVVRTGVGDERALPIIELFRSAVQTRPDVLAVGVSAFALDEGWLNVGFTDVTGAFRTFDLNMVSADFPETMGMTIVAGRSFSRDLATDSSALVVNEAFATEYGWADPQDAIGQRLPGSAFPENEIVGVVRDFNYESLRNAVRPAALAIDPMTVLQGVDDVNSSSSPNRKIALRIRPDDISGTLAMLSRTWDDVAPDLPYDYYFLDEAVNAQYAQEKQLGQIVSSATLLSVVIACLGLFGLATLTVVRRTKEIGIRKVLGASVANLVVLLSRDFAGLVLVSFVVAAPLSYLAARSWLNGFAYRIDVPWAFIVAAGVLGLAVALATVSYHSVRAAKGDPVRSLRYE